MHGLGRSVPLAAAVALVGMGFVSPAMAAPMMGMLPAEAGDGTPGAPAPVEPEAAPAPDPAAAPAAPVAPSLTLVADTSSVVDVAGTGRVSGRADIGDELRIKWKLTNTGTSDATSVSVVTGSGTTTCAQTTLAAGDSMWCTTTSSLGRSEVDGGSVTVSARASGTSDGATTTTAWVPMTKTLAEKPALSVAQSWRLSLDADNDGKVSVGDKVTFVFTLTNTGNVTLTTPAITSRLFELRGMTVSCRGTTLYAQAYRPGHSVTCWSESYDVRKTNQQVGEIVDRAVITAKTKKGTTAKATSTVTVRPVLAGSNPAPPKPPKPQISLVSRIVRVVDQFERNGLTDVGDDVYLEFVVTNTGKVALRSISVTDRLMERIGTTVVCPSSQLAAGASMTCRGATHYTVTRNDFRSGSLTSASVARGASVATGAAASSRAHLVRPLAVPLANTLGASARLAQTGADGIVQTVAASAVLLLLGGAAVYRRRPGVRAAHARVRG